MATQIQPKPQHIGGVGRKKTSKLPKPIPPAAGGIQLDLPALDLDLSSISLDPLPDLKLDLSEIIRDLEELPAIPSLDLNLSDIFGAPPPKRRKRPRRT